MCRGMECITSSYIPLPGSELREFAVLLDIFTGGRAILNRESKLDRDSGVSLGLARGYRACVDTREAPRRAAAIMMRMSLHIYICVAFIFAYARRQPVLSTRNRAK